MAAVAVKRTESGSSALGNYRDQRFRVTTLFINKYD